MGNEKPIAMFNMAIKQLIQIGGQLDRALYSYSIGDLPNWYYNLKGAKLCIIDRIDETERAQLKKIEDNISEGLLLLNSNKIDRDSIATRIEEYHTAIMDILRKRRLLNPDREDKTLLFGQDESFG